ncbi:tonB-system energizer ExbB [Bradyrhizobium algeriense]|uniref:tonB-system energizer ExbB n=1 Tax=Bradyrhizobium algeriense TaxID=634784 RepID=UPI001FCE60A7|nr:tonB-system energizer ExbB [Bradyrhizobium algeriense]
MTKLAGALVAGRRVAWIVLTALVVSAGVAGPVVAQQAEPSAQAQPAPPLPSSAASSAPGAERPAAPSSSTASVGADASVSAAPMPQAPPALAEPSAAAPVSPSAPAAAQAAGPATLPHDLSPWSMFMQADMVVKAVMVGLAFASLLTWTVWLAKGIELTGAKRNARSATRKLNDAESLADASRQINAAWTRNGRVADLVNAALAELQRSTDLSAEGIKERLAIALSRIEAKAGRDMARGTGLLATIGATAPFVGLFGTVWGIMNSFIGISQSKTTNLAVVAPGIAEALLATAIGLVAAIPAVIIYNVFARAITGYRALLSDASGEVLQHMSRDLEWQEKGVAPARAIRIVPSMSTVASAAE